MSISVKRSDPLKEHRRGNPIRHRIEPCRIELQRIIFDPQRTQQAEPHYAVSGGNAVQIVHAAVEDLQRLAHLLEKHLAELRQLHVAPVLFKQRHTELLLQLRDGVAQARLRYSDRGR